MEKSWLQKTGFNHRNKTVKITQPSHQYKIVSPFQAWIRFNEVFGLNVTYKLYGTNTRRMVNLARLHKYIISSLRTFYQCYQ